MESPLLNYKKDRAAEYPSVEEQLDMIWHELNEKGTLTSSTTTSEGVEELGIWFNVIKDIKDRHPKPAELDNPEE